MESHTCHNIDNTIRYTHSLYLHSISSMATHLLHSSLLGLNSALIAIRGLSYPGRSSEGRSLGGWASSRSGLLIPRWPWMPWDVIVFDIWNSFVLRAACSAANVIDVSPYDVTVIQLDVECERTLDFTN